MQQATQLQLDFTFQLIPKKQPIPTITAWLDASDIACGAGFHCACEISQELYDHLSDQVLYDALWTAWLTLELDRAGIALFTLEVDGKPVRFKAELTHHAVRLGRVDDF